MSIYDHDIRDRQPLADRISQDVADFLAKGGEIDRSDKCELTMARFNNEGMRREFKI